tara:strand:+ start:632 stop:796 length:165 start_codon:yes stop_codon:yes gene_type:complete
MPRYRVITEARVTTEYIVEAVDQDDAREMYYDGAVEEENILDTDREEVHTIDLI